MKQSQTEGKISIIIPSYNRSSLIGATLASIIQQTYPHWECIVVDDGSTDVTQELLNYYCLLDKRIQFHQRPTNRIKGANSCRNYGFEKSRGRYIQWFDSDDLMVPDFLEKKIKAIEEKDVDFVISRSANFEDPKPSKIISKNEQYYTFNEFEITNYNYVVQNINWLTYDFFAKREVVENIKFNENLKSAQERNYFSKLTCFTTKATILDDYLTLRRIHPSSIRWKFHNNRKLYFEELQEFFFETYKDLKPIACQRSILYLLDQLVKSTLDIKPSGTIVQTAFLGLLEQRQFKRAVWFLLFHISQRAINRGHFFRQRLKNTYE